MVKLPVVSLFLIIFSFSFLMGNNFSKLIYLIPILMCLFFLYSIIRKKYIFITSKGIRMGNVIYWAEDRLIIRQKPVFLLWNKIKDATILSKSYKGGIYGGRDFAHVHLKTKKGIIYDCLIYDPEGFVLALNNLKKIKLLSKNSMYWGVVLMRR